MNIHEKINVKSWGAYMKDAMRITYPYWEWGLHLKEWKEKPYRTDNLNKKQSFIHKF